MLRSREGEGRIPAGHGEILCRAWWKETSVQSIGYDQIQRGLLLLQLNIDPIATEFLGDIAGAIFKRANELVPVKTGFLKSSIQVLIEGDNIVVGAFAPYAGFVEFGTSKMPPKPYLRPAVQEQAETLAGLFFRKLERLL